MSWGTDFPFIDLAQRIIETRLRAERLSLARRLQSLESRAESQKLPTGGLKDLRKSLLQATPAAPDRVDRLLVLPRKSTGFWRRRYLAVTVKPGSVF